MAYEISKADGSPMDRKPASLTVRLAGAFKREGSAPGAGMGFVAECKALTDKDKADFTAMFEDAGYPVLAPAVKG